MLLLLHKTLKDSRNIQGFTLIRAVLFYLSSKFKPEIWVANRQKKTEMLLGVCDPAFIPLPPTAMWNGSLKIFFQKTGQLSCSSTNLFQSIVRSSKLEVTESSCFGIAHNQNCFQLLGKYFLNCEVFFINRIFHHNSIETHIKIVLIFFCGKKRNELKPKQIKSLMKYQR